MMTAMRDLYYFSLLLESLALALSSPVPAAISSPCCSFHSQTFLDTMSPSSASSSSPCFLPSSEVRSGFGLVLTQSDEDDDESQGSTFQSSSEGPIASRTLFGARVQSSRQGGGRAGWQPSSRPSQT
ncbi:hypothetical protein Mapa_010330 [Marchantia paleacea]|nr:hypothetical protein Mapa_010330 [Marchantia paleacea]